MPVYIRLRQFLLASLAHLFSPAISLSPPYFFFILGHVNEDLLDCQSSFGADYLALHTPLVDPVRTHEGSILTCRFKTRSFPTMLHTVLRYLTLLGLAGSAMSAADHWILTQVQTLAAARMDPIVNPGNVSSHVHNIMGGSAFSREQLQFNAARDQHTVVLYG